MILNSKRSMTILNYYKVLRLSPTATPKEIQKAFIELSILFDGSKDSLTKEVMEIIREAFSVLREPDTRARYDLETVMTEPNATQNLNLTKAKKIIASWRTGYTEQEQKYIERTHFTNRIIKIVVAIAAIIFLWLVVTLRIDIAMLIVVVLAITYRILWFIYRMINPSPSVELWGIE